MANNMALEPTPIVHQSQPTPSASTTQSLVTLKNKKVIFKQQPLGLDQALSTISERLNFHTYIQTLSEPLKEFPVAHLPLIAKLVHECEETYHHAAARIHKLLTAQPPSATTGPTADTLLSKAIVDAAVRKVSERTNWGVDNGVPGATIWRLEAKDRTMLPAEFQQICEERWKERNQAKLEIQAAFARMSEADRVQFVKSTGATTSASTDKNAVLVSPSKVDNADSTTKKASGRSKKQTDTENAPRDKDKVEKKTVKSEKDKKEAEGTKKSAAAFASFFTRPAITRVKTDGTELSDYDKDFQSFVVKRNTVRTPVDRFAQTRTQLSPAGSSDPKDLLKQFLDSEPMKQQRSAHWLFERTQNVEVRAIMDKLNDAEVLGDSRTVRRLTALLKNRRALPAKLFHFHENNKPPYYGTWTKSSLAIQPRHPFGKDASVDYEYDSDDDWEEEGEGEAVVSDGSDEEASDEDEDEDGWLVDEGELGEVPAGGVEEVSGEPSTKRKFESTAKNKDGKRRKVERLIPFQKGPCWETQIGECLYEPFNVYRIQLLNGCPYPVDPFTFIEDFGSINPAPTNTAQSTGNFAAHIRPTSDAKLPGSVGPANRDLSSIKKVIDAASIKNPFPDTHLPELYSMIEGSEKTLKGLVEDLYLALKKHPGVKKYAIEAKLREVADKTRTADVPNKRWRVCDEAWTAIGVPRPS